MTRYRTIVADPPWAYPEGFATQSRWHRQGVHVGARRIRALPYESMTTVEITALPVAGMAAKDCRLFLWTTNFYLPAALRILAAWGFTYKQALVWHKRDGNMGGSVAPCSAEFLLVGVTGSPKRLAKMPSAVITTAAPKRHSRKPEAFLDHIEQVSPGPYLEMFARRARFGWDYYGDESLGTAEMAS